jgi:hypothetical protein
MKINLPPSGLGKWLALLKSRLAFLKGRVILWREPFNQHYGNQPFIIALLKIIRGIKSTKIEMDSKCLEVCLHLNFHIQKTKQNYVFYIFIMDPFLLFMLGLFNPSSKMTLLFIREGFVVRALGPYTLGSNGEA